MPPPHFPGSRWSLLPKALWCLPGAVRRAWGQGGVGRKRVVETDPAGRRGGAAGPGRAGGDRRALCRSACPVCPHMKAVGGAVFVSSHMAALLRVYHVSPAPQLDHGVERDGAGRALALTWHRVSPWALDIAAPALGPLAVPQRPRHCLSSLFAGKEFALSVSPPAADPLQPA